MTHTKEINRLLGKLHAFLRDLFMAVLGAALILSYGFALMQLTSGGF